jgi:DNA polymerase-4
MDGFCRDCLTEAADGADRCRHCRSPRLLRHDALYRLAIAHVDCDAFYASIEKRDNPMLRDKPVIVGGGRRGVVAAACYVARTYGVRSAMPMFQARALCPDAIVVKPDMAKYVRVGRAVRARMLELTPLVEPLSIDEAFMDLSGTTRLHRMPPARALASFARQVEQDLSITISIGLSENKFLAKIASDLDKPRGFSVLDQAQARALLATKPVEFIWGVGKAAAARLAKAGYRQISELQAASERDLIKAFGNEGQRLWRLSRGIDNRPVHADREAKSVSAETTFDTDIGEFRRLEKILWPLCEKVSGRLKGQQIAGSTVTLKLKSTDFRIRTRARGLESPSQLATRIFAVGRELLAKEADGTKFRLLGIAVSALTSADQADPADLVDGSARRAARAELALDSLREKFGRDAVFKGLSLETDE